VIKSCSILFSICLLLSACDNTSPGSADADTASGSAETDADFVLASNYPQYFVANRLSAGIDDGPRIVFPRINGDPANWIPTSDQIEQIQSADLILLNGAGAESWLDLVTLRNRQLVDTTSGLQDRLIPLDETVVHQHGPEGEHSHQGTAFTTWLDPVLLSEQAIAAEEALTLLNPQSGPVYTENLKTLKSDLAALDQRLEEALGSLAGQTVLFSHPVYQYLARRYNLKGISLHWEPGEEPGLSDWIDLQRILASNTVTFMIWEDEPLEAITSKLLELGVVPIPWHTAGNLPDDGDFLTVMLNNADRLESFLTTQKSLTAD
jgi:zinc transport system substrate-binding protein